MSTQFVAGLLLFVVLAVFFVRLISLRRNGAGSGEDIHGKGLLELASRERDRGIARFTGQP